MGRIILCGIHAVWYRLQNCRHLCGFWKTNKYPCCILLAWIKASSWINTLYYGTYFLNLNIILSAICQVLRSRWLSLVFMLEERTLIYHNILVVIIKNVMWSWGWRLWKLLDVLIGVCENEVLMELDPQKGGWFNVYFSRHIVMQRFIEDYV